MEKWTALGFAIDLPTFPQHDDDLRPHAGLFFARFATTSASITGAETLPLIVIEGRR